MQQLETIIRQFIWQYIAVRERCKWVSSKLQFNEIKLVIKNTLKLRFTQILFTNIVGMCVKVRQSSINNRVDESNNLRERFANLEKIIINIKIKG